MDSVASAPRAFPEPFVKPKSMSVIQIPVKMEEPATLCSIHLHAPVLLKSLEVCVRRSCLMSAIHRLWSRILQVIPCIESTPSQASHGPQLLVQSPSMRTLNIAMAKCMCRARQTRFAFCPTMENSHKMYGSASQSRDVREPDKVSWVWHATQPLPAISHACIYWFEVCQEVS